MKNYTYNLKRVEMIKKLRAIDGLSEDQVNEIMEMTMEVVKAFGQDVIDNTSATIEIQMKYV